MSSLAEESVEPPPPTGQGPDGTEPFDSAVGSVGKGAFVLVLATTMFILLGFFARILIARELSVAAWGEFSLGLALSSLLAIVVALGLPNAVSRALSYEVEPTARRHIVRVTLLASLLSALAGSVAVFLAAPYLAAAFHDAGLTFVFELFAPSIGFSVVSTVVAAYFQGLEKVGPNAIFNLGLNPALFLGFLGLSFAARGGFPGILVAYTASAGLACAAIGAFAWVRLPKAIAGASAPHEPDPSGRVSLLTMTVTLFGTASMNLLTQYADTLILGVFWSTAVVGLYSAGMTLARLFVAGSTALLYIYLPVSSRLRRTRDYATLRSSYVTSARWVMVMTLPVFCVFFFDPVGTIGLVFGANYTGAVLALRILTVASFLSVIIGPANAGLSGLGHPSANFGFASTALVLNVALSLALIPTFGLLGAAVAWSVARLVYTGSCLVFLWVRYRVTPFAGHFLRPLVLGFALLAPVFYLAARLPTSVIYLGPLVVVAFVVAGLAVPWTNSVERGDMLLLRSLQRVTGFRSQALERYLEGHQAALPVAVAATTP
jgi:O-antigen/teichoic acid export membrane protein